MRSWLIFTTPLDWWKVELTYSVVGVLLSTILLWAAYGS